MKQCALINAFDKTALYYDKVAILPQTIARKLLERLKDFTYFYPKRILDLGCGTGFCLKNLHVLYPKAHFVGIDWSYPLLKKAHTNLMPRNHSAWILIQADMQQPLFIPEQFDLICANLSLLWIERPMHYLMQIRDWLKPNGLFIATWLGIDTLTALCPPMLLEGYSKPELKYPWSFCDLHILGDALVNTQWEEIVMNVEHFLLKYTHQKAMYAELEQLGLHTLLPEVYQNGLQQNTSVQSDCAVQWEVIYGHAWKPEPIQSADAAVEVSVPIHQLHR